MLWLHQQFDTHESPSWLRKVYIQCHLEHRRDRVLKPLDNGKSNLSGEHPTAALHAATVCVGCTKLWASSHAVISSDECGLERCSYPFTSSPASRAMLVDGSDLFRAPSSIRSITHIRRRFDLGDEFQCAVCDTSQSNNRRGHNSGPAALLQQEHTHEDVDCLWSAGRH